MQGDTDPRCDAHSYLKGSTGDLWLALAGARVLFCTHAIVHNTFAGYFLKLQLYEELMGLGLEAAKNGTCHLSSKAVMCEIRYDDEGVRMEKKSTPISLRIRQVTHT